MDALLTQVKSLAANADDTARGKIINALRDAAVALEKPNDTIHRLAYRPAEITMLQVGVDLGIFKYLAESDKPLKVEELASKTGADPLLLFRILRFLASFRILAEVAEGTYGATHVTRTLANPGYAAGIPHHFYTLNPALQALPQFLKDNKYQNITDTMTGPFPKAHNSDLHPFIWVQTQPQNLGWFVQFMDVYHEGKAPWTRVVPFVEQCRARDSNAPLFVDVGGGLGSQCVAFLQATPGIEGRVILQDLPETLQQGPAHEGVEKMAQNFFEPQAVKGAKYYFLRNILHDYPDDRCIAILKRIIEAMGPDSIILINELVLPNVGAHWRATQTDVTMMACLASMERTEKQWYALLHEAGLKVQKIRTYAQDMGDSVIEAVVNS